MVFPNRRAIFCFDAFACNTWAYHFRQTIDVYRIDTTTHFNRTAHIVGPRLRAKNTQAQTRLSRVQTLSFELIGYRQHITRRDHDQVGFEILYQLHLTLGLSATKRHDRQTQSLSAVVRTQTPRE